MSRPFVCCTPVVVHLLLLVLFFVFKVRTTNNNQVSLSAISYSLSVVDLYDNHDNEVNTQFLFHS